MTTLPSTSNLASPPTRDWLALMIGNSRLHWAWFSGETLQQTWDLPHLPESSDPPVIEPTVLSSGACKLTPLLPQEFPVYSAPPPLWVASVVPQQTGLLQSYPKLREITLAQVPLRQVYPTLGIDRALALWGALRLWRKPALVMDAGTAFAFTGANLAGELVGGAILPGLGLQLRSLSQNTAALPLIATPASQPLPPRWASSTEDAILSGVLYSLVAGIQTFVAEWLKQFPDSVIVLTGGDAALLLRAIAHTAPDLATHIIHEPDLVFWGMRAIALQL